MAVQDLREHTVRAARRSDPHPERNPGIPLDLEWVRDVRINTSAVERRAATLPKRRTVKKDWQAAWYLRAITCMDLTTLQGDDTPGRVRRLCAKARRPVRQDILEALGVAHLDIRVASACFPAGLNPLPLRIAEIRESVAAGAGEIDIVISRAHVLTGDWQALYDEVRAFREACGPAHLKAILATGELGTLRNVARASRVAMMAGADFIKTSTGKEKVNATLPVSLVMVRAIREYRERTGYRVGFKPAGGISTARQSADWLALMKEELGDAWMRPGLFRIGASSLLGDLERQLEHHATGRYSANFRHPVG